MQMWWFLFHELLEIVKNSYTPNHNTLIITAITPDSTQGLHGRCCHYCTSGSTLQPATPTRQRHHAPARHNNTSKSPRQHTRAAWPLLPVMRHPLLLLNTYPNIRLIYSSWIITHSKCSKPRRTAARRPTPTLILLRRRKGQSIWVFLGRSAQEHPCTSFYRQSSTPHAHTYVHYDTMTSLEVCHSKTGPRDQMK